MSARSAKHAFSFLHRYGRAHRRPLAQGLVATIGVAAFRLAMPWPLRGVVESAFPHGSHHRAKTVLHMLPSWGDPLFWLCLGYLGCTVGYGISEMVQRTNMVQFVSRTARDIRRDALHSAANVGTARVSAGELISRLVADLGRFRSDLTGILVHVSKDGLLFLAVAAMFLVWLSPAMGAFFVVGGVLTGSIGYLASHRVVTVARRARHHEGAFAATIQKTLEQGHLTSASPPPEAMDEAHRHEGRSTRIVTASSIAVHAVLALTVSCAVWVGVHEIRAGVLAPGELFLFMAYAIMIHRRLVDAGRQLARIGKVRACIERIEPLITTSPSSGEIVKRPLRSAVRVERLRVEASRGRRPRLADIDVEIVAGTRIAVLGRAGDGKSTFLRCLAGAESGATGTIHWDGIPLSPLDPSLRRNVGYLPQDPVFALAPVWQILGLSGPERPDAATIELLTGVGAWRVIERFKKELLQKLASTTLSREEARAVALGAVLLGDAPLLVLDSPLEGLGKTIATMRLETLLTAAEGRTLVVALPQIRDADTFDRVIVLRRGSIDFDGTPAEWRASKAAAQKQEVEACRA